MYVARACMGGGRGWNVGNMKYSQGVACTSYQSYTCKISNACVWGKIGCIYVGRERDCVCVRCIIQDSTILPSFGSPPWSSSVVHRWLHLSTTPGR